MNSTIPDLWPQNLQTVNAELSPVKILRQQAYALGQRTRNFVVGKVHTIGGKTEFHHDFWIQAPLLNFEERILIVRHASTSPYPATIIATDREDKHLASVEVTNPAELMDQLKQLFSEPRVVKMIGALWAQSNDGDAD